MITKSQFIEKFSANFQAVKMINMVEKNIIFALNSNKENKELLEELQNFPQKNLQDYNKFCDKFLRKELGDVIGVDSLFVYTHAENYIEMMQDEFEIKMDNEIVQSLKEVANDILQSNVKPLIGKHSWASKVSNRH